MATKFLRKIIMEELKNVLKEEVGTTAPSPLNTQGLIDYLLDKSMQDQSFSKTLSMLSNNDQSAQNLAKLIYGQDDLSTYTTRPYLEKIKAAIVQAQELASKRLEKLPDDEAFKTSVPSQKTKESEAELKANQDKMTAALNAQMGKINVPAEETSAAVDVKTGYEISSEGKWGKSCEAARSAQREARKIVERRGPSWEKRKTLLNRLKDSIMGATTLSMINASIAKNNLGSAFSLDIQGARKACADRKVVPQAIKQMSSLGAQELAAVIEGANTGSQVASADTVSGLAESKLLEKRILQELAKMLGK